MFPHLCGAELAEEVLNGADPTTVVPDRYTVVRGGLKPIPTAGSVFSAVIGPTFESAAAAVPHGSVRFAIVAEIRRRGGVVEWRAEFSPHGTLNEQHVNVSEDGDTIFSEPLPNPVSRRQRIDQGK